MQLNFEFYRIGETVRNGTTVLYTDFQVNERLNILNFLDITTEIAPDVLDRSRAFSFIMYADDQSSIGFEGTDPTEQTGNSSGLGNGLIKNLFVIVI